MQSVSVFITAHLYTLSSLFILLHSVLRLLNCIRYALWNYDKVCALYTCSYNLGLMGQILQLSSCCVSCLHFFES